MSRIWEFALSTDKKSFELFFGQCLARLLILTCLMTNMGFVQQLNSQVEDLTKDSLFFSDQVEEYQKWLDFSGIGSTLNVYHLEIKPDQLTLYLSFSYSEIDSVVSSWNSLKLTFDELNHLSIEQQLFYKLVNYLEVRQNLLNIQIYDTYDLREDYLFFRDIRYKDGRVQVEESNPKSKIEFVTISSGDFSQLKKHSKLKLSGLTNRQVVFSKIFDYSKSRYEKQVCQDRNPEVRLLESSENLRFEVIDLCREVLIDEANPLLCRILRQVGHECNWVKREMIIFTIKYEELSDGFSLSIDIVGKYGSGIYRRVKRGAYLNMEIDFDDYLEQYADKFKESIYELFRSP